MENDNKSYVNLAYDTFRSIDLSADPEKRGSYPMHIRQILEDTVPLSEGISMPPNILFKQAQTIKYWLGGRTAIAAGTPLIQFK